MLNLFTDTQPLTHHQVGVHTLPIVRTVRKNSIALKHRESRHSRNRGGEVVILVPKTYSNKRLKTVLLSHQTWLEQSLNRLTLRLQKAISLPKFSGKTGESFSFLGEEVVVVYELAEPKGKEVSPPPMVHIKNKQCTLRLIQARSLKSERQVCLVIESFMKQALQDYLSPVLEHYAQRIGVMYQAVTVKGYKARWGSCYSDGRLQFNWRLIQAPSWVVDYVVVHELCHLVHPNHSRDFWALVQAHYPKTNEAKAYIKQHGKQWISFLQK